MSDDLNKDKIDKSIKELLERVINLENKLSSLDNSISLIVENLLDKINHNSGNFFYINGKRLIPGSRGISITKNDVGLGNVNNTPDIELPISKRQLVELKSIEKELIDLLNRNKLEIDTKIDDKINELSRELKEHIDDCDNPHKVDLTQLGTKEFLNKLLKDKQQ